MARVKKVKVRTGKRYRAGRTDEHYDVIVVGSGIGGLTNAALLSLLGKKVCVLEQHYTAGGYTHAYEREGYEWDVGVHYIGEVHKPSSMRRMFDVITEGRLKWAEMDAVYDKIIIKGKEFNFIAGRDNFVDELCKHFPDERKTLEEYVQLIRKISSQTPKFFAGQAMPSWMSKVYNLVRPFLVTKEFFQNTREVLEKMTQNQELISVLTGQWGNYGQAPADASFIMHALIAKHYLAGGAYPVGGAADIARSIIPTIQKSGGEVFTYADVDEFLIKDNTAYGVRMSDGSEIMADTVISNAGFMNTIEKLLPEESQKRHNVKEWTKNLHRSSAHLGIYAGFKGTSEELGLNSTNLWIYPDGDHEGNLAKYNANPEAEFPLVYISFPSSKDPDWENRFPGKSTVEIVTPAKMDWFKQWENTEWGKRGEDYEAFKESLKERLLDKLFERHPQLRDKLDYVELSTPLSTNWYQKNSGGEMLALDHFVERFKQSCLHPQMPVKNLYMTGSDVMTAGVGGALMGGVMSSMSILGLKKGKQVMNLFKNYQEPSEPESELEPAKDSVTQKECA